MKVGLFFGSFNPIHVGHLIIANVIRETTPIDEIWFVVSPQNPFKKNKGLLHEFDRIDLVRAAIEDDYHFKASDVEFGMPRPSYTIDTLTVLAEKYPQHEFSLIIGEDNLGSFRKWKNHQSILEHFQLIVYPRPHSKPSDLLDHESVLVVEAPMMEISATLIRKMIKSNQSIKYLVPHRVEELIKGKKYYQ
ncbi:MAG: nicotinate-nucleotide adenylyltransferase [Cyclobacteriaceae bacterium]